MIPEEATTWPKITGLLSMDDSAHQFTQFIQINQYIYILA